MRYQNIKKLYFNICPKWKECKKSYGNQYTDKSFYVIRRRAPNAGLMSYVIIIAGRIEEAVDKGMIPVIDMKNAKNPYLFGVRKGINAWELFFEQPMQYTLEDIGKAKNVYYSSGDIPKKFPDLSIEYFTDPALVQKWKEIFHKYIRLNEAMFKYADNAYNSIFSGTEKVIGVLCRGTDYLALKPYNHPIQPTAEEIITDVEQKFTGGGYNKIFLATEDSVILGKFKKHFGDVLITNEAIRYDYESTGKKKMLSKMHGKIDQEGFVKGRDYLVSIYCLSKCKALIAGMTSGSLCAFLMNDNYEYTRIYDKGRYGIGDK